MKQVMGGKEHIPGTFSRGGEIVVLLCLCGCMWLCYLHQLVHRNFLCKECFIFLGLVWDCIVACPTITCQGTFTGTNPKEEWGLLP